jgi:hypothetical protein
MEEVMPHTGLQHQSRIIIIIIIRALKFRAPIIYSMRPTCGHAGVFNQILFPKNHSTSRKYLDQLNSSKQSGWLIWYTAAVPQSIWTHSGMLQQHTKVLKD